jgi:hypothetical protein
MNDAGPADSASAFEALSIEVRAASLTPAASKNNKGEKIPSFMRGFFSSH